MNIDLNKLLEQLSILDLKLNLDDVGNLKVIGKKENLTASLISEIKQQKEEIVAWLSEDNARQPVMIKREVKRDSLCATSFSQQRLWFIDKLQGGTPEYNLPMAFKVQGELDIALVNRVFTTIIERHEILRTVYVDVAGVPRQQIQTMADIQFAVVIEDMSALDNSAQHSAVEQRLADEAVRPFDLSRDLMIRLHYLRTSANSGILLLNMHHIASDGWSIEVLTKEFFTLYGAYRVGSDNPLPELDIQYADYAHWQRTHFEGEVLDKQLDYWEHQLNDVPIVHSLPLNYPRPKVKQYVGATVSTQLPSGIALELQRVAKQHQLTPFMLFHGALSLLLSRYSNSTDIVLGTPMANRMQEELAPLIGFFVNTLVLRADTSHTSLAAYFKHIRQLHLDAQLNQDVPFEQLVERLKVPRSSAYSPLFQIMMTTSAEFGLTPRNFAEVGATERSEVEVSPYQSKSIAAKFDLNVDFYLNKDILKISWGYDVSLFNDAFIQQLNTHLTQLLTSFAAVKDDIKLSCVQMLSEEEIRNLLYGVNKTQVSYPDTLCIHELFEQQVAAYPMKEALRFEGRGLSYAQLNARANRLAHYLVERHQIVPDTLVGLCTERSLEMLIGILAILKAGGAYVPLDPSYPQERLNYMFEDANLKTVLVFGQGKQSCINISADIVDLSGLSESDSHAFSMYSSSNIPVKTLGLNPNHLAYMVYTSGSTGNPKGVLNQHGGLVNLTYAQCVAFDTDASSKVLQFASISFDASVFDWTLALCNGSQLVVSSEEKRFDTKQLFDLLRVEQITHVVLPPALLSEVKVIPGLSLKSLIVAGEACAPEVLNSWGRAYRMINAYGPSENTVCATAGVIVPDQPMHIGRALNNVSLLVLDAQQSLLSYGAVGELYIGGDSLARGYLNRPSLTAERFIANPFYDADHPNSSERLYRTGDIVRYLPDGNLEFIGRMDEQVKIRGFRVELGEIEAKLAQQEGVDSALVQVKEVAGSKQLVGYLLAALVSEEKAKTALAVSVKAALAAHLPDFMIPSMLVVVNEWPMTPNGKIDKKALPILYSSLQIEYVAPSNTTEQVLCEIWGELLGLDADRISVSANFFELGGHSLLITRLVSLIEQRLSIKVSVKSCFSHPRIASFAKFISEEQADSCKLVSYLSHYKEELTNIFCLPGAGSLSSVFSALSWQMSGKFNVIAFDYVGVFEEQPFHESIDEMALFYAKQITKVQPFGAINLLGHSFGGLVALQTALALQTSGRKVNLISVDSYLAPKQLPTVLFEVLDQHLGETNNSVQLNEVDTETSQGMARLNALLKHQTHLMKDFALTSSLHNSEFLFIYASESYQQMEKYGQFSWVKNRFSEQVTIDTVIGDHYSILKNGNVGHLAERITMWLLDLETMDQSNA